MHQGVMEDGLLPESVRGLGSDGSPAGASGGQVVQKGESRVQLSVPGRQTAGEGLCCANPHLPARISRAFLRSPLSVGADTCTTTRCGVNHGWQVSWPGDGDHQRFFPASFPFKSRSCSPRRHACNEASGILLNNWRPGLKTLASVVGDQHCCPVWIFRGQFHHVRGRRPRSDRSRCNLDCCCWHRTHRPRSQQRFSNSSQSNPEHEPNRTALRPVSRSVQAAVIPARKKHGQT